MTTTFKRDCATCKFMEKVQEPPPSIISQMVCRFSPPSNLGMPTPNGITWFPIAHIVKEGLWCWQYTQRMDG